MLTIIMGALLPKIMTPDEQEDRLDDSGDVTGLDRLPTEVLEVIAGFLSLSSVTSLMCTNRRLFRVFNESSLWKKHLCYPEKWYRTDARSRSTAPLVAAVLKEIAEGRVGKWRGWYKLQRARHRTWAAEGCTRRFDYVPVAPKIVDSLCDVVDDRGERWLFTVTRQAREGRLQLQAWNMTASPRALRGLTVGPDSYFLGVLPQGKLLLMENKVVVGVYRFEHPKVFQLQYRFLYDKDSILSPDSSLPAGVNDANISFIIVSDLFVVSKKHEQFSKLMIHIWNLTSAKKTTLLLSQSKVMHSFESSLKLTGIVSPGKVLTEFFNGGMEDILVALSFGTIKHVIIYNLKSQTFTHVLDQTSLRLQDGFQQCYMYSDKVCIVKTRNESDQPWHHTWSMVELFSTTKDTESSDENDKRLQGTFLRSVHGNYRTRMWSEMVIMRVTVVSFKQSKVIVQNFDKLSITNLDNMQEVIISLFPEDEVADWYLCINFIEPYFLLMYSSSLSDSTEGKLKAVDIRTNKELFQWENTPMYSSFIHYYMKLEYPAKLILPYEKQGLRVLMS